MIIWPNSHLFYFVSFYFILSIFLFFWKMGKFLWKMRGRRQMRRGAERRSMKNVRERRCATKSTGRLPASFLLLLLLRSRDEICCCFCVLCEGIHFWAVYSIQKVRSVSRMWLINFIKSSQSIKWTKILPAKLISACLLRRLGGVFITSSGTFERYLYTCLLRFIIFMIYQDYLLNGKGRLHEACCVCICYRD